MGAFSRMLDVGTKSFRHGSSQISEVKRTAHSDEGYDPPRVILEDGT